MGILDTFRKKKREKQRLSETPTDTNEDPFKSDPFMDPDSGLNLPKDEENQEQNPYMQETMNSDPFQKYKQTETFQQEQQNNQNTNNQGDTSKDIQLILAKLDAIKAEVQSINHRVENIEKRQQKKMW